MKRVLSFMFIFWLFFCSPCWADSQTPSGVLASAIIDDVEELFNDTGNGFLDATEALAWLNQGTMDIAVKTHCLEAIEDETLVSGTSSYALADPFIKVRAVVYEIPPGLKRLNLEEFIALTRKTGAPKHWTLWENNILLHPVPANAQTDKTIDVYTVERPATVAADADVLVPAQYDRALILYIYSRALLKDKQFAKAAQIKTEYESALQLPGATQ